MALRLAGRGVSVDDWPSLAIMMATLWMAGRGVWQCHPQELGRHCLSFTETPLPAIHRDATACLGPSFTETLRHSLYRAPCISVVQGAAPGNAGIHCFYRVSVQGAR
jgi:hypothetical protein